MWSTLSWERVRGAFRKSGLGEFSFLGRAGILTRTGVTAEELLWCSGTFYEAFLQSFSHLSSDSLSDAYRCRSFLQRLADYRWYLLNDGSMSSNPR